MKTPIVDFVRSYAAQNGVRLHMPGHKGRAHLGCESLDITEIAGADVLYEATGVIGESEQNATTLFGSAHTFYSTEGATLAIKAMLATVKMSLPRGTRLRVLAARNAHKAFLYAAALLDIDVTWLYPAKSAHFCACPIDANDVAAALLACKEKPHAVYLTSPDYLGNVLDIQGIAAKCKACGVPLLVDNAHGAYLGFLQPSRHPLALGATMCADSAHKTLPALTGGAYLHIAKEAPGAYLASAREALSLFASTSPSYLILQSLDLCNAYLENGYTARLSHIVSCIDGVRAVLRAHGYTVPDSEPLKIVIKASDSGYTGEALAELLRENGIEPEFADREYVVLMCTTDNTEEELVQLCSALCSIPLGAPLTSEALPLVRPLAVLPIREAMLAPFARVPIKEALGRICATPAVSCPPAVPVAVAGERIDATVLSTLAYYGVESIAVLIDDIDDQ